MVAGVDPDEDEAVFGETLDHKFFYEETTKLISLCTQLINERELFYRGVNYGDRELLNQMREELLDLKWCCEALVQFDANQKL